MTERSDTTNLQSSIVNSGFAGLDDRYEKNNLWEVTKTEQAAIFNFSVGMDNLYAFTGPGSGGSKPGRGKNFCNPEFRAPSFSRSC